MILPALALLLLAAAPAGAQHNMAQARQAYSQCLGAMLRADLKAKVELPAFEAKVATACSAQADSFKRIVVAADVASGLSRASAEQGVNEEIASFREGSVERYRDYLESNTEPR